MLPEFCGGEDAETPRKEAMHGPGGVLTNKKLRGCMHDCLPSSTQGAFGKRSIAELQAMRISDLKLLFDDDDEVQETNGSL